MKKLLILSLVFCGFFAQAQIVNFGVKAGFNLPDFKIKNNPSISDINIDNGTGFHVGAMARIKLLGLYVQPELLYTKTSTDYAFNTSSEMQNGVYTTQRLDIPVNVGLKIGPAAVFAGPIASFNLASPDDIFEDSYKTATWGYQVGAGVKLKQFLLEVKYEGAFHSHTETAIISGNEFALDARMQMVIFSVGYFFRD